MDGEHAVVETNLGAVACCWRALTKALSERIASEDGKVIIVGHEGEKFDVLVEMAQLVQERGSFVLMDSDQPCDENCDCHMREDE